MLEELNIPIKLLHEDAKVPTKAVFIDAGWDLYSVADVELHPPKLLEEYCYGFGVDSPIDWTFHTEGVVKVPTGISIAIPTGYVGLMWDRSGLSIKNSIHRVAGVIDASYTGEIVVGLLNLGNQAYQIKKGDRIAQLVIQEIPLHVSWEVVDKLPETSRGERGLGSSGR